LKPHSSAWVDCQFILALLVAALFSELTRKSTWLRFFRAFQVLVGAWKSSGRQVDGDQYQRRLATCQSCVVFFKGLNTCGSPLKTGATDLGCWCHLPTKARLKEAQCWLDEYAKDENGKPDSNGWEHNGCA